MKWILISTTPKIFRIFFLDKTRYFLKNDELERKELPFEITFNFWNIIKKQNYYELELQQSKFQPRAQRNFLKKIALALLDLTSNFYLIWFVNHKTINKPKPDCLDFSIMANLSDMLLYFHVVNFRKSPLTRKIFTNQNEVLVNV